MFLFSCNSESKEEKTHISVVNEEAEQEACNLLLIPDYLGSVASDGIGIVKVNLPFPTLEDKVGYEVQFLDQILSDNNKGEKNTRKINHLFYNVTEVMCAKLVSDTVTDITTYDKRFYTSECINVGSSFQQLSDKYTIEFASIDNEEQFVYVSVLELGNVLFGFSQEVIVDLEKVDRSIGVIQLDNLDVTKGSIISVKVINK